MSEVRLPRRRRSAARTPAIVDPADIPEDAAGRIEVIVVRAPADVIDPGDRPEPPDGPPQPSRLVQMVLAYRGWVAIGVLVAVIVVLFVLGITLTR